ncbi:MAG: hypothetical protein CMQ05_07320 [Gammaproteobacteria bacterium]|nr:hypothetical protein [Gammaproteobacteria bacterium]
MLRQYYGPNHLQRAHPEALTCGVLATDKSSPICEGVGRSAGSLYKRLSHAKSLIAIGRRLPLVIGIFSGMMRPSFLGVHYEA